MQANQSSLKNVVFKADNLDVSPEQRRVFKKHCDKHLELKRAVARGIPLNAGLSCLSLITKLNLHKGHVRNSRLRVLLWIQSGAFFSTKKKDVNAFKLSPKELGNSECE